MDKEREDRLNLQNDIKALEFRDELIKLCKEYNCKISGTYRDDGNIGLELCNKNGWCSDYIIKNTHNNYSVCKEDNDYNYIYVMDSIIQNAFNQESGEMAGLNNIKVSCGILTNDPEKADEKLQELYDGFNKDYIEYFSLSNFQKELRLKNGFRYLWIKVNDSSRGYRCKKIIIDRNITLEELQVIILPMCYAVGRDDYEIF